MSVAVFNIEQSIVCCIFKLESAGTGKQKQITYPNQPPNIEWHLARKPEEFDLMTVSAWD